MTEKLTLEDTKQTQKKNHKFVKIFCNLHEAVEIS
jgi:hypothetical protein